LSREGLETQLSYPAAFWSGLGLKRSNARPWSRPAH